MHRNNKSLTSSTAKSNFARSYTFSQIIAYHNDIGGDREYNRLIGAMGKCKYCAQAVIGQCVNLTLPSSQSIEGMHGMHLNRDSNY